MTATTTVEIWVGSFQWLHSDWFDANRAEDEELEETNETCLTCGNPITNADANWYCADNGEMVHDGCEIPNFDEV